MRSPRTSFTPNGIGASNIKSSETGDYQEDGECEAIEV